MALTTVLQAANAVLLSINERPLPNLSSVVGQQVRNALASAQQVMSEESDWTWLTQDRPALSWTGHVANLGEDIARIKLVQYQQTDGTWEPVPYVTAETFDEWVLLPSSTLQTRDCERYTLQGWNSVLLNPYPADELTRARLRFRVQRTTVLPESELATLDMPEQFVQALIKRASQEFALRHSEDVQLSSAFANEYLSEVDTLKQRHRQGQVGSYNMYRGARRRQYGYQR